MINRFIINFNELSTMKNINFKKYTCIFLIDKELKIVSELFQKTEPFFKKSCLNSNILLYLL